MLSGGAARGAGQVGMLRVLLEHGIVPDAFVAGSVGALNATFVAQNLSLDQVDRLEAIYRRLGNFDLIGSPQTMVLNVLRHRPSLASGRRIRDFIASCVPVPRIEDLPLPVRIASFDLDDGRFTWHDAGNLVDAVAASCALPAIYPPVEIDGHLHVDYGVRFAVPTDAAVDLARPGDTVWSLEVNRVPVPRAIRSPWEALMTVAGASIVHNSLREFPSGVTVHRIVLDRTFDTGFAFNFTHTTELVELGRQAALAAVEGVGVVVDGAAVGRTVSGGVAVDGAAVPATGTVTGTRTAGILRLPVALKSPSLRTLQERAAALAAQQARAARAALTRQAHALRRSHLPGEDHLTGRTEQTA
ncbi:Patatin [Xylanimonas cellulosilytica DSM 15894]|uniref:Patatin n=1 Tax=Xylanimonas cellulosilytica (strain DSM 15894 / JCM 12276 / CECT 5975 / KCTC 9989 / LMG 20990 / NBRC 107835 / XIL07) TaxID=446471 RepID=D1BYG6_XYLCX|nr:Patatin [Xylanimonas cellulosilytica DSM 15894]